MVDYNVNLMSRVAMIIYLSLLLCADYAVAKNLDMTNNIIDQSMNQQNSVLIINKLSPAAKSLLDKIILLDHQKFSKKLLAIINRGEVEENFACLVNLGAIQEFDKSKARNQLSIFKISNDLQEYVNNLDKTTTLAKLQQNIIEIIDNIDDFMPSVVIDRYMVFANDLTLINNLEKLLVNTEYYQVDNYKILLLRKNLFDYYLNCLDYAKCEEMTQWLIKAKTKNSFDLESMTDQEKSTYSEYLNTIGIYYDFAKSDHLSALKYMNEAKNIIDKLAGYQARKFTIYAQLAQVYAFGSDVPNAQKHIDLIEQLIKDYPNSAFDFGLLWFIKAKVFLTQGKYDDALQAIEQNIIADNGTPQDTFSAPTYIMQAEILNYQQKFQAAYEISKRIYKQEKHLLKEDHEMHARSLTQLSRAELGLKKLQEALKHASYAKSIYINDQNKRNENLATSHDNDLAAAFVAEGEALVATKNYRQASECYLVAEIIFNNRYKKNIKYSEEISELYYKIVLTAKNLNDNALFNKFKQEHLRIFGAENATSIKILNINI